MKNSEPSFFIVTTTKNELQTLRLFSPLFPHIYRKNEWGDLDNYLGDLTSGEVLEYENEILAIIQKKRLSSEGDRGLAVYGEVKNSYPATKGAVRPIMYLS